MYLFLSDETNTTQTDAVQFLIFGAMVIPMENAPGAVKEILEIRQCYGYPSDSEFKFDTHSRPSVVTKAKCDEAKNAVLELAERHEMRFMACITHHKIAINRKQSDRVLFGLKTLLCEFDTFLTREKASGICAIDRFEIAHSVLSSILVGGVDPDGELGKFQRHLSNIWLYSVTSISCSHLCSVCDIVLGTFRYCVNSTAKTDVAKRLYPRVRKLFLHDPNAPAKIENWGLFLRPKVIRAKVYADEYEKLRVHLKNLE